MRRHLHARRGFTLIELMIGGLVAFIMLAAALALFLQGISLQQKQRKMAEMKRSAALWMGQLTTELRQAGLGRPRGGRLGTGTGQGDRFPASILVAEDHRIAFLADVPRPNSTFNGYSQLAGDQTAATLPDGKGVALLNELNGNCDVIDGLGQCTTDVASQVFDYATSTGATNCATSPGSARTCPWSLNRYQPSESIIVADGLGRWVERQVDASVFKKNTVSGRVTLLLDSALPAALVSVSPNQGFVSTPDRIFYRLQGDAWERKQCWGALGAPLANLETPCTANGTDWEPWVRVGAPPATATFTYYKVDGSVLTTPVAAGALKDIARVDISLQLTRINGTSTLQHVARGSITLRQ